MDAIPITKKLIAFGSKKIYLYAPQSHSKLHALIELCSPKFTVAFVRTPRLSPYHARFLVPLDFSKYDLRDYLYHAYNVRCFNIRSFVKQMPVRDTREQPRHWFRADSKKYMTVELEDPFVWPEEPDLTPWGKDQRQKELQETIRVNSGDSQEDARAAARSLREQVEELLKPEKKYQKREGEELTAEERLVREKAALGRSRLQRWADQRTGRVVGIDRDDDFTFKV